MPSLQQSDEASRTHGKQEKPDKSEVVQFRCSTELKRAIRVAAAQRDMSIEDLCAQLLAASLENAAA